MPCTPSVLRRMLHLGEWSVTILKFLIHFYHKAPHFHFRLLPANYVTRSGPAFLLASLPPGPVLLSAGAQADHGWRGWRSPFLGSRRILSEACCPIRGWGWPPMLESLPHPTPCLLLRGVGFCLWSLLKQEPFSSLHRSHTPCPALQPFFQKLGC